MNELDKHLTTALQGMEQRIQQRQDRQANDIRNLQQSVSQLQARQQQSERALQDLSNVSVTLQSLLAKLNSLFASK